MTPITAEHAVVRLERTIPAPPHRVYRAWLEPDLLRRWLAPGGLEVKRVDVDEGVGGHYRVWQADSGADVGGFDCELLELVPDQRIVFRWGFVGPDGDDGPAYDSLLTITLREAPGGRHGAHPRPRAAGRARRGDAACGRERGARLGARSPEADRHHRGGGRMTPPRSR
jgi:uncharacterized protein YndB with AHSA1/START domain